MSNRLASSERYRDDERGMNTEGRFGRKLDGSQAIYSASYQSATGSRCSFMSYMDLAS